MAFHRALYEVSDREGSWEAALPVVGQQMELDGTKGQMLVEFEGVGVRPFGQDVRDEERGITYRPFLVHTVEAVIPAEAGWVCDLVLVASEELGRPEEEQVATMPVLAWAVSPPSEDSPGGEAVLLAERETDYWNSGPILTLDLPGEKRYRRAERV